MNIPQAIESLLQLPYCPSIGSRTLEKKFTKPFSRPDAPDGTACKGYDIIWIDIFSDVVPVLELPAPPDGGWGWGIVFASFMNNLIIDGIAYRERSVNSTIEE